MLPEGSTEAGGGPAAAVVRAFRERFGAAPEWVARAPGRVNLIGEHTDYNDGFVLPMAIDRAVWIALRARGDRTVAVHSLDFGETRGFGVADLASPEGGWIEYVRGMAWALEETGRGLDGWEGVAAGDVPIGAGLSSSAAMELATARAFCAVSGFAWDAREMAVLAQRAENGWVGVHCGVMDQMISAAGEGGHALLIDCRSLETRAVPLPPGTAVVILDTGTRRGLVDSAYNERRRDTQAAAAALGVPALRDVSVHALERRAGTLEPLTYRRARHVVTENERTLRAAGALERGDAAEVGRLMGQSHASLRDDYEVSTPTLDALVERLLATPGVHGARLTGAGFGGCALALVDAAAVDDAAVEVVARYRAATGRRGRAFACAAADGVRVV
jgi:galactokinase